MAGHDMGREKIPRLDSNDELREKLIPHCRLRRGEVWEDCVRGHRVGCLDAACAKDILKLMNGAKAALSIQDPPYNVIVGNSNTGRLGKISPETYIDWSRKWVSAAAAALADDAHFYVWLGADQNEGFQPLPDFMLMMRDFSELAARSFITMRNQRGYGTQKNWMAVRQELLYYIKGNPGFNVNAEYTDIPKILRGYYKKVGGRITDNFERSNSDCIRAGNVWVDIQQVFYRMEENVPGCYAQKPLKAIERIVSSGSGVGNTVSDYFSHAGTTLIACDKLNRLCNTADIDPVFAEITIRRLERFRKTGKTGWQFESPFPEVEIKLPSSEGIDESHRGQSRLPFD